MKTTNVTTYIGLTLLVLFLFQYFFKLEWTWLLSLQHQQNYKRWSGLGLALLITFQWVLTLSRIVKKFRKNSQKMLVAHKWVGALTPVVFYLHSMGMGYGYLALLAYIFITNTLIGYVNLDVIKNNSEILFKGWMILHVAFSILITLLMFFHITMVFYYK